MTILMETETEGVIWDFLGGKTSPSEFEAWIISAVDGLSIVEQTALWEVRLLLIEYGEGMRTIEEVKRRAADLLTVLQRAGSENSTTKFEVISSVA